MFGFIFLGTFSFYTFVCNFFKDIFDFFLSFFFSFWNSYYAYMGMFYIIPWASYIGSFLFFPSLAVLH